AEPPRPAPPPLSPPSSLISNPKPFPPPLQPPPRAPRPFHSLRAASSHLLTRQLPSRDPAGPRHEGAEASFSGGGGDRRRSIRSENMRGRERRKERREKERGKRRGRCRGGRERVTRRSAPARRRSHRPGERG
uniref:Uncharacterized protein n=1 Tax=Aegilops tauschii subsp. strangulata TaxID=200361 RepID=A0A452Y9B4_AEGTS